MDWNKISALIDQKLANFMNKSQFGVSAVQHHTHNGVDSPKISYSSLLNTPTPYAGGVNSDGTKFFLPSGWASVKNGTGDYTVTHNLNISIYGVVATQNSADPGNFGGWAFITALNSNSFSVQFIAKNGSNQNGQFYFTLSVPN